MTTQYVAMRADDTVDQTIEALRALDEDHPTVSYVYVLNEYDKLIGVLSLRTLVLATKNTQLPSPKRPKKMLRQTSRNTI